MALRASSETSNFGALTREIATAPRGRCHRRAKHFQRLNSSIHKSLCRNVWRYSPPCRAPRVPENVFSVGSMCSASHQKAALTRYLQAPKRLASTKPSTKPLLSLEEGDLLGASCVIKRRHQIMAIEAGISRATTFLAPERAQSE